MSSLAQTFAEDRRRIILVALHEGAQGASEKVLLHVTEDVGHNPTPEQIRADIKFLADNNLLRVEKHNETRGEIWIAHLLPAGRQVAKGAAHPGVAERELF